MLRQMRSLRAIAAVWGVGGTAALLVYAIARLAPVARVGLAQGMPPWGWAATAAWIAFMAYFEGYRGFQRGFAPRAVERARALARDPRPLRVALAPLYCMSLFAAERRRLVAAWALLAFIVGFVIAVVGPGGARARQPQGACPRRPSRNDLGNARVRPGPLGLKITPTTSSAASDGKSRSPGTRKRCALSSARSCSRVV
jgi:hypothetical protein